MRLLILTGVVAILTSCATGTENVVPQAIGGSKSDGTIQMAYESGGLKTTNVNWTQGEANALKRCQAWGYTRVESFSGGTRTCIERGRGVLNGVPVGQCAVYQNIRNYQCLD